MFVYAIVYYVFNLFSGIWKDDSHLTFRKSSTISWLHLGIFISTVARELFFSGMLKRVGKLNIVLTFCWLGFFFHINLRLMSLVLSWPTVGWYIICLREFKFNWFGQLLYLFVCVFLISKQPSKKDHR